MACGQASASTQICIQSYRWQATTPPRHTHASAAARLVHIAVGHPDVAGLDARAPSRADGAALVAIGVLTDRGAIIEPEPRGLVLVPTRELASQIAESFTVYGRYVYAIGGNRDAAEYSGINVRRVEASTYLVSAATAGVAGVCYASYIGQM